MKSGIYKITNPEGKVYIGCSKNLENRKNCYKNHKISSQKLIFESIIKFGWDKHLWEEIEYTFNLKEREKFWISEFNSFIEGLNSNLGGGGPLEHSNETKNLISIKGKANKGKRINSHWKGKNKGEEFSEKLSISLKGKPSHRKGRERA
jgi:group I intron endonuclease